MAVNNVNTRSLTTWPPGITLKFDFIMSKILLDHFKAIAVFCLAVGFAFTGLAVDGATTPNVAAPVPSGETAPPNDTLRAYLQLQEQIHATQLSIERTREESQATEFKNSEALSNRLQLIESSL